MFHVKVHFSSIKTLAVINEPIQINLKKNEWHYAISAPFQLQEMTNIDITAKFDIAELYPNFLINLIVVRQNCPSKILGQIDINIKEWPIGDEKRKKIIFQNGIEVELSIFSEYASLQMDSDASESQMCLSIEELQQQISQKQQLNNHLNQLQKQLTQKRDLLKVKVKQMGELIGIKIIQKHQLQKHMEIKKKEIADETQLLTNELNEVNEMLVSIVNVVNERGEAQICDEIPVLKSIMPNKQSKKKKVSFSDDTLPCVPASNEKKDGKKLSNHGKIKKEMEAQITQS